MFASLSVLKILTTVSIGLGLFLIALGIFYLVYKYRLKNPKEYEEENHNGVLSPYHFMNKKMDKKRNKKLVKTNKILLKEYKKQYNRKEITLEEYQFLTSSLLGNNPNDKKIEKETEYLPVEENQENNYTNKLDELFIESELKMEEYLELYHLNSLDIIVNIREQNNITKFINKKKIILNKIHQLAINDLEQLSEIEGLTENREGLVDLIKKELNDISLLEQNLWDDELCSIYYLESYVYTYIPKIVEKEVVYNEEETSDRAYSQVETEMNRNYQEVSKDEK